MITALSGGTGSVKLVRGLSSLDEELVIIANVGDNITMHGFYVAPDVDTIVYGLSGRLDEERGWGINGDTFNFMDQMKEFTEDEWFNLGDKDLAFHSHRTRLLKQGQTLSSVTMQISERLGIKPKVIPASDDHVQTKIRVHDGEIHFQEYWVKRRAEDTVLGVKYEGSEKASPSPGVVEALSSAQYIVLCPANPITSIGPILSIPGIREVLRSTSAKIVSVSPLIGNHPLSGPAARLMDGLRLEVSPVSVAKLYTDFLDGFIIDHNDEVLMERIESLGVKVFPTDILMNSREKECHLARFIMNSLECLG